MIQHHTDEKTVPCNNIEEKPNCQQILKDFGTLIQFQPSNQQLTSKERSANAKNQSTKFTEVDEPINFLKNRLNNLVITPFKTKSTFQHQSIGGRGRGAYARYGGGGREDRGSGPTQSQEYSTIYDKERRGIGRGLQLTPEYPTTADKGPQITATLDTQEDITIYSDSERSINWKDQVSDMMKNLRE